MGDLSLNFKYKFSEQYNPVYVNGAYGGVGPQGEVVINFYFERQPIPYEEKVKLDETGQPVGPNIVEPGDHSSNIIRYVQTGIVMNLESAKHIHKWLGQHIQSLENIGGEE